MTPLRQTPRLQLPLPRPALMLAIVAVAASALTVSGDETVSGHGWHMNGHDVRNTRSQPHQNHVTQGNARRLAPKWVLTVGGDVSATPTVGGDHDQAQHDPTRAVYFPDWGVPAPQCTPLRPECESRLWKVDAETGEVIWSRRISEYNGIAGSISRTSPVLAEGLVVIGDLNGNLMAVDAGTGDLEWITELDANPNTIVTTSPVVLGQRVFIATSSSGGGAPRQIFRGSMLALDLHTGQILWQSFVLPDNGGVPGGFAGGAFVNPPAIDEENGLVFGAAGQLYFQPASVTACLAAQPGGWSESCFPAGAHFNSVIAFDLDTGQVRWSFRGAGPEAHETACGSLPPSVTWCPPASNFSIWDFAGSGVNVISTRIDKRKRTIAGIGQKSGVYWALDAVTGEYLWSTLVGPGSDPGGIQWGTAYDGQRIYAAIGHNTGQAYRLVSGQVVTGGSWAALDPATGRILWQTADPQGAPDLASLTEANGVLYGGSMAHTGDQMYALDTRTGAILWKYAAGGSVVGGPAVVRGTAYWGSGYARTGGVGNDKFYAFSLDGK